SSNFTRHGLMISREAGYTVTDPRDVKYFVERFDHYYARAVPLADELLKKIEEWLRVHPPYHVYMRSLLELYGLPEEEKGGTLPELAGYQRPIVSRILRTIDEYGGAMLIASTGLGKTVMAGHAVAYLTMENKINSVIVLCPAGLKTMWRRTLRAARVSSVEFSYYILSLDDWRRYRDIGDLEYELRRADERTLIILDESHHLRNQYDGQDLRLRSRRIVDVVGREAKVLLMTATPYSREIDDVNAQLMLLPGRLSGSSLFDENHREHWSVRGPRELSEIAPCVVLTAPSVVCYFSSRDENGERFVVFSGNQRRYFPRTIRMVNVPYVNPCDAMLMELLGGGLLSVRQQGKADRLPDLFGNVDTGRRDPLLEARIVHQFCSSLKEVDSLLGKMEEEGGFDRIRFENQELLGERASAMRREISPFMDVAVNKRCPDGKIAATADIIARFPGEKVVVFCVYRETARYVKECLSSLLPGRSVEMTVDRDPDAIEEIIDRFAPVANSGFLYDDEEMKRGDDIDILVATTAMSEGFNFQDASVLINFDLPWTVLVLAQRMGRILRPWHVPREIHVFNLMPSTMDRDDIHHALNWKERLDRRGREFTSFAEIPVVVDKGTEFEMAQLSRSINILGDVDLDLDEVFSFIERADNLKTSGFIDDLAALDPETKSLVESLPPGFKSLKRTRGDKRMYLLFQFKDRAYPALFDTEARILLDSEMMDQIMMIIRSAPEEESVLGDIDPSAMDLLLERCRNTWAARRRIRPDEAAILCWMMLM
ncbi:MAG: DEAD/DEAH box helicase, partial [Spirochaetes bacterium]|nr:DEAD/DEAH box helicase [Spirochaetota bacterium]